MDNINEQKKDWCVVKDNEGKYYRVRIRKLTPTECFRLMGVSDENAAKMLSVCSKSQAYKQAGNSIVVDNMFYLFESLIFPEEAAKRNLVSIARNAKSVPNSIVQKAIAMLRTMFSKDKKGRYVSADISSIVPEAATVEEEKPRYRQTTIFDILGEDE